MVDRVTREFVPKVDRSKVHALIEEWLDVVETRPLSKDEHHALTLRVSLDSGWSSSRETALRDDEC